MKKRTRVSAGARAYHKLSMLTTTRRYRKAMRSGVAAEQEPEPPTINATPVIVIGMHRSGTTLVTRLLQKAGAFMGAWRGPETSEAWFFQIRNHALLQLAHADWDQPEPFEELLDHASLSTQATQLLYDDCTSRQRSAFMGRIHKDAAFDNLSDTWGWKDPRNTITLPLWLDVFPKARVIHVIRNGVDVAYSLQKREKDLPPHITDVSMRCMDLDSAFDLWRYYVKRGQHVTASLPTERVCEIKYETLLEHADTELPRLLQFAGVSPDRELVQALLPGIRSDRAYGFKQDASKRSFYEQYESDPLMQELRYAGL